MADERFFHRQIFLTVPGPHFCADCGEEGVPEWVEVTTFNDPPGEHRFAWAGRFACPNGPHRMQQEARRG